MFLFGVEVERGVGREERSAETPIGRRKGNAR
jgi:hypothetical protein